MLVTLAAGVGIAEGIEASTGLRADLKWPNDLVVARRKLAGILAEVVTAVPSSPGRDDKATLVIVGFGINVNSSAFPRELTDIATSIEGELGRPVDRPAVLAGALEALAARYDDLLDGRFDAILDAWRRRAPASAGTKVTWKTAETSRSGITDGIDDNGALLVRVGDRVERIVAGEVTELRG
jgi:BirA family biotin operon repressor/biotin-[acetyl-CoA-carboxylase] ligase